MTAAPNQVRAPAKLTLSLRITGVRADGYHLLDAEMVSLELADGLTFTDGDGLTIGGPFAAGVPTDDSNLVRRACASSTGGPPSTSTRPSRPGAGSAAGRPTPPPSSGGPGSTTWPCRHRAGRRRPVLPGRRPGPRPGRRGAGGAAPADRAHLHVGDAARRRVDPGRLPGLGRAGRSDRWAQRPRARGPGRGPRAGPVARPDPGGRRRAAHPGGQRGDLVRRRCPPRPGRRAARRIGGRDAAPTARSVLRAVGRRERSVGYLLRRWWRVRRSIFLCFFFRMRLRRFLISEPTKRRRYLPAPPATNRPGRRERSVASRPTRGTRAGGTDSVGRRTTLAGSSMAEHLTLDQGVGGSSPPPPAARRSPP